MRVSLAVGVVSCFASSIVAAPPKEGGTKTAADKVQLVCGPKEAKIQEAAQATLDAAWAFSEEMLGDVPESKGKPAVLYLDSSIEDYEKAEAKLTGGAFKKNLAFTHKDSRTAHVAFQPPCSQEVMKKIGLPIATRHLIAHEAFHLVGYSHGPEYSVLPSWIKDGAASYVACETLTKHGWSDGPEQDPFTSTDSRRAVQLLQDGKLPKIDKIMHSNLDALPPITRYGVRWLLFRFLEEGPRPGSGKKLIRQMMRAVKEFSGDSAERDSKLAKMEKEYSTLDDAFVQFVHGLKPQWKETFRSLDTHGKQWRQLAFPEKNAIAWRVEPVKNDSYELTGHVRILPGTKQQMNLLLSESDEGFISVAFVADYGVTLFRYRTGKEEWEKLATAKASGVEKGSDFSFRVRIAEGDVKVFINKKSVVTASVGDYPMKGPWGLGAQAGSAGIWSQVHCKPLTKPKSGT